MSKYSKQCIVCGKTFSRKLSIIRKQSCCSRECRSIYQTGENNPKWRGGSVAKACRNCGKEVVLVIRTKAATFKYCSLSCKNASVPSGEKSPLWKGGGRASKIRYRIKQKHRLSQKHLPFPRLCVMCGKPGIKKGTKMHTECRGPARSVVARCQFCGVEKMVFPRPGHKWASCGRCSSKRMQGSSNPNWKGGAKSAGATFRASDEYKAWRTAVFTRDNYTCQWCGQHGGRLQADHIKPFSLFPELRLNVSNGRTLCLACHQQTDTYLGKLFKYKKQLQIDARKTLFD